jgi:hypothetical protein
MLSRKIRKTVPLILHLPALLAHTIYQAISFDSSMREQGFDLPGTTVAQLAAREGRADTKLWEGISDVILGRDQWFDAWLEGERKCKMISKLAGGTSSQLLRSCGRPVHGNHQRAGCMAHRQ